MNQELVDRVVQSRRLPTLPKIALQVISLAQDPEVDFKRIVDVVQYDSALSIKILKAVNSAFYGQPREISTITRALQVLGLSAVKILALGFSLVSDLSRHRRHGFDHVSYWRRSLFTASAARTLSRYVGLVQQEEAFLGGLLQDVGVMAMSQALGEEYAAVVERAGPDHAALAGFEVEALGADHAEVGAALTETWGLPPLLVALIRYHEDPAGASAELQPIVRCVALGNSVAEIFVVDSGDSAALSRYCTLARHWFGIERETAEHLLREIHEETLHTTLLLEVPTGDLGNPDEILARANETLMQLTLQAQQQNQQLFADVNTDALTGVSNRRAFDQCIEELFGHATSAHPLSVLFVDIDHFKRFNDTYGHALGDEVLVAFARALQSSVGRRGKVFRCGGEEFGIVCAQTAPDVAAHIAEDARAAVERTSVVADTGEVLRITCSIGVATHTGGTFSTISQLLKTADEYLYEAKAAGRNCVRLADSAPAASGPPASKTQKGHGCTARGDRSTRVAEPSFVLMDCSPRVSGAASGRSSIWPGATRKAGR